MNIPMYFAAYINFDIDEAPYEAYVRAHGIRVCEYQSQYNPGCDDIEDIHIEEVSEVYTWDEHSNKVSTDIELTESNKEKIIEIIKQRFYDNSDDWVEV